MSSGVDSRLIEACARGEKEAWDRLVEEVSGLVYYFIRRLARSFGANVSDEDTADIFQNVFVALHRDDFRKLRTYSGQCKFTTWLSFVVRSVYVDYFRVENRSSGSGLISLDGPADPTGDPAGRPPLKATLAYEGEDALSLAEREETRERARSILAGVPPRERLILQLFYLEGKKYREIAAIMGIPINTVASAMSRVRSNVKKTMGDAGEPEVKANAG